MRALSLGKRCSGHVRALGSSSGSELSTGEGKRQVTLGKRKHTHTIEGERSTTSSRLHFRIDLIQDSDPDVLMFRGPRASHSHVSLQVCVYIYIYMQGCAPVLIFWNTFPHPVLLSNYWRSFQFLHKPCLSVARVVGDRRRPKNGIFPIFPYLVPRGNCWSYTRCGCSVRLFAR